MMDEQWLSLQFLSWKPGLFLLLLTLTPAESAARGFFYPSRSVLNLTSKTFTACIMPLTECPQSHTARTGREICLMGHTAERCKTGTHYACGNDTTTGFLVEGCFESNECDAGTTNQIRLDIKEEKAKLQCVICNNTTYQPFSSDFVSDIGLLGGCKFSRTSYVLEAELPKMILIDTNWPLGPDRYSCDAAHGYSDMNGKMYCYVNDMCHCTNNFVCLNTTLPDLLPDGSCGRKCGVERDKSNNYVCSTFANKTKTHFDDDDTSQSGENPIMVIIGVIIGVILLGILIGTAVYCHCRKTHKRHRNQADDICLQEGVAVELADRHDIANGPQDSYDDANERDDLMANQPQAGADIHSGDDIELDRRDSTRRAGEHDEDIANADDVVKSEHLLGRGNQAPGRVEVTTVNAQNYYYFGKCGAANIQNLPQEKAQADVVPVPSAEDSHDKADESLTEAVQERGGVSITNTDGASDGHVDQIMDNLKFIDEDNTEDITNENTSPKQFFGDTVMER